MLASSVQFTNKPPTRMTTTEAKSNDLATHEKLLKHAAFHNCLANDVYAASYTGSLMIGLIGVNKHSDSVFDESKSIEIKPSLMYAFVESIKRGEEYFANKPDESFEMDLLSNKKKDPIYKLTATFGKYEDAEFPSFSIRQRWHHKKDKLWAKQVAKGAVTEIQSNDPWQWTRKGVIFSEESIAELINFADQYLMKTYIDIDVGLEKKITDFVLHATTHFYEEVVDHLNRIEVLRFGQKVKLIDTILLALVKDDETYKDNPFLIKQYRDMLVGKQQLLFALLKLRV